MIERFLGYLFSAVISFLLGLLVILESWGRPFLKEEGVRNNLIKSDPDQPNGEGVLVPSYMYKPQIKVQRNDEIITLCTNTEVELTRSAAMELSKHLQELGPKMNENIGAFDPITTIIALIILNGNQLHENIVGEISSVLRECAIQE